MICEFYRHANFEHNSFNPIVLDQAGSQSTLQYDNNDYQHVNKTQWLKQCADTERDVLLQTSEPSSKNSNQVQFQIWNEQKTFR
jgi:hypothetical protein